MSTLWISSHVVSFRKFWKCRDMQACLTNSKYKDILEPVITTAQAIASQGSTDNIIIKEYLDKGIDISGQWQPYAYMAFKLVSKDD